MDRDRATAPARDADVFADAAADDVRVVLTTGFKRWVSALHVFIADLRAPVVQRFDLQTFTVLVG